MPPRVAKCRSNLSPLNIWYQGGSFKSIFTTIADIYYGQILPRLSGKGTQGLLAKGKTQDSSAQFRRTVAPGVLWIGQVKLMDFIALAQFMIFGQRRYVLRACAFGAGVGIVGKHDVEQTASDIALQSKDMVRHTEPGCFTILRSNVAYIDMQPVVGADSLRDATNKQVRQDAGIQAARADHDDIGSQYRTHRFGVGAGIFRCDEDALDAPIGKGNLRFPDDAP